MRGLSPRMARHCNDRLARSTLPPPTVKEAPMKRLSGIASILLATTASLNAAEVTFERLRHPEPQNWLMNHHDFSAHRYSTLDQVNKDTVQNLHLAFAIALG